MRFGWGCVLALAGCMSATPAQGPEGGRDTALAQGDIDTLSADMTAFEMVTDTDAIDRSDMVRHWLEAQAASGLGSAAIPTMLARFYQDTGQAEPAMAWLAYARAILLVDAAACSDDATAQARLSELGATYRTLDAQLRTLPPARITAIIDGALSREAQTWPSRRTTPSRWLCAPQPHPAARVAAPAKMVLTVDDTEAFHDGADWTAHREASRAMARRMLLEKAGLRAGDTGWP